MENLTIVLLSMAFILGRLLAFSEGYNFITVFLFYSIGYLLFAGIMHVAKK